MNNRIWSRNEIAEFSHGSRRVAGVKTSQTLTGAQQSGNSRNEYPEFSHDPSQLLLLLLVAVKKNRPGSNPVQTKAHTQKSEIAATKTRNFRTVGGHFSRMKKRQNTSFSKENSELLFEIPPPS